MSWFGMDGRQNMMDEQLPGGMDGGMDVWLDGMDDVN